MPPKEIQASQTLAGLVSALDYRGITTGLDIARDRAREFGSVLEAQLTGIVMDPVARKFANDYLTNDWRQGRDYASNNTEVVIGAGYHAAVYCAARVQAGYPSPLVVESNDAEGIGGSFAMTTRPAFYLNSRNRAGSAGIAGDSGAQLNYIPGGIIQPANMGMREFQTNTDMAMCIRLTLAQYARVVAQATVQRVEPDYPSIDLVLADGRIITAKRIIDARGLGQPAVASDGMMLNFPDFMQRMAEPWPLRGMRRVAVVGGGDSGKCAVESLLGLSPEPYMATPVLDSVERVDWYGPSIPLRCKDWTKTENARGEQVRGRYRSIGHYLRSDAFGVRRLEVVQTIATVVKTVNGFTIAGRTYDMVVMCTGNKVAGIPGIGLGDFYGYVVDGANGYANGYVAKKHRNMEAYEVGPVANLPWQDFEYTDGTAQFENNRVSMFRTGKFTAALATNLANPAQTL